MGSECVVLQFLTWPGPLSSPLTHRYPLSTRCFSTSTGGSRGGARWETKRNPKDYYERVRWDEDKEVEFGNGKQRIWWSHDTDYEDDDDDDGFGVMESSIGFSWVMKVLRAFGWMIPAIIMSAVLGSGTSTNTIIMAVALPLAQSALSLVMDAILGWSGEGPRSKSKKKKRPYGRAVSDPGRRAGKGQKTRNREGVGDSQSWTDANGAHDRKNSRSTQNFGGWDELDNHGMEGQLKKPATQRPNEPREWTNSKSSKRIGKTETPLLLRLLIAVFPFLGSWTKLL